MQPPIAVKRPVVHKEHEHERLDQYAWLKDKSDPEVIEYLEQENSYCEQVMSHTEELRQELYDEMLGRIQEDDSSVPYKVGDWWVYSRMGPITRVELYSTQYTIAEVVESLIMLVRDRARATYNRF